MRETTPILKPGAFGARAAKAGLGDAEMARRLEGTVDTSGMRSVTLTKSSPELDIPRVASYQANGYEVVDEGWRFVFRLPQVEFDRRERERIAISEKRQRLRKDPAALRDDFDTLEPVSADDFLTMATRMETPGGAAELDGRA